MKIFKHLSIATTVAAITFTAVSAMALSASASATTAKPPSCATVSLSLIRATLGGKPTGPKTNQYGDCLYGTVTIAYSTSTLTNFRKSIAENKFKAVSGVGSSAYTFGPSGTRQTLTVLVGTVQFTISSPTATLVQKEALAKKMVRLV